MPPIENFEIDSDNGCYTGSDGGHYRSKHELFKIIKFKLCGCGNSHSSYNLLYKILQLIQIEKEIHIAELLKNNISLVMEIIFNMLTSNELLDHGSSIRCPFITEEAEQILQEGYDPEGITFENTV